MRNPIQGLLVWLLLAGSATTGWTAAGDPPAASPATVPTGKPGVGLSASPSAQRAQWQQRLTLGPGDLLNLSLFEMPDTARLEVPVGPDGRITFLQARDIPATGLTIDELRVKLDQALEKYYQNPRTIVIPAAFKSKKYFVLGAVVNKGVYSFDRPLTLIEAIARAGGLETGVYERKTVELADLPHSFLVRGGQRVPVDFERLFQRGDLGQNIPLEPEDFLYFASATGNEIYVLGEVLSPGVYAFAPKPTVISAITARGGFSDKAFKGRVLVIRGSLNNPETFVVDTGDILSAREKDFRLQSKDIVYVGANPWTKVADILDVAARAFLQAVVVTATSGNVGSFIK